MTLALFKASIFIPPYWYRYCDPICSKGGEEGKKKRKKKFYLFLLFIFPPPPPPRSAPNVNNVIYTGNIYTTKCSGIKKNVFLLTAHSSSNHTQFFKWQINEMVTAHNIRRHLAELIFLSILHFCTLLSA